MKSYATETFERKFRQILTKEVLANYKRKFKLETDEFVLRKFLS